MTKPLRLMIYDNTDIKFNLKQLQQVIPKEFRDQYGVSLDSIDCEFPFGLTHQWFVGGVLYRALRWVDKTKGFSNWGGALDWVLEQSKNRPIEQIQVWGHGSPGKSWMKREPLHANSVQEGPHAEKLQEIGRRMTDNGTIWFRNCSVFCGEKGHEFAKSWSNTLDCRIAAHTYVIHAWQSGLHTISPGEEPSWSTREGIQAGTPDQVLQCKSSFPWAKNTIFMIAAGIPEGW